MNDALQEQICKMTAKSRRALKSAADSLCDGNFESVSSRAYYAVFYVLEALLLTRKMAFSKHSAVIGTFSRYFVKEKLFSADIIKRINHLRREREIGDYDYESRMSEKEAREDLKCAREIIKEIIDYIKRQ